MMNTKKNLLLATLCLAISHIQSISQEIPNGNFEVWDLYNTWTLEPQYWTTQNNQLNTPITQDEDAAEGNYAMRVKVLPGFEGGIQQIAHISIPIEYIPVSLNYWVKAVVPDTYELDNVTVTAAFYHSGDEVYHQMDIIYDSIPVWEEHFMNFPAIDVAVDEVRILVSAGFTTGLNGGSWDTWISVDDMKFSDEVSISQQEFSPVRLYPNPFQDVITVKSAANGSMLVLTDLSGKTVIETPTAGQIDLTHLPDGIYIATIKDSHTVHFRQKIVKQ
jgi:hypothetical protein